ncbi:MAG: hypothetical protein AABZ64_10545 [Nitrospinota bacterium]
MGSIRAWWKAVAVVIVMGVLGGCALIHSEIGTALGEKQSFKEWSTWDYPGNETGNRNAYEGKK